MQVDMNEVMSILFSPFFVKVAKNRVGDLEYKDILQDVAINVWKTQSWDGRRGASLRTYLYRAMMNRATKSL